MKLVHDITLKKRKAIREGNNKKNLTFIWNPPSGRQFMRSLTMKNAKNRMLSFQKSFY